MAAGLVAATAVGLRDTAICYAVGVSALCVLTLVAQRLRNRVVSR